MADAGDGTSYELITNAGYVKGKKSAKRRVAEINRRIDALKRPGTDVTSWKFTHKYRVKGTQPKRRS